MDNNDTRGGGSKFPYERFGTGTNEDETRYRNLLRSLGTPEQLAAKFRALDELLEEKRRRDWLLVSVRTVATWAAAVATGWLAFKGLLTDFLTGIKK